MARPCTVYENVPRKRNHSMCLLLHKNPAITKRKKFPSPSLRIESRLGPFQYWTPPPPFFSCTKTSARSNALEERNRRREIRDFPAEIEPGMKMDQRKREKRDLTFLHESWVRSGDSPWGNSREEEKSGSRKGNLESDSCLKY